MGFHFNLVIYHLHNSKVGLNIEEYDEKGVEQLTKVAYVHMYGNSGEQIPSSKISSNHNNNPSVGKTFGSPKLLTRTS